MAHIVLMTRGVIRQMEEFEALMRAQRFPWKIKNLKTGQEELRMVQGALRPIRFYEYIVPEESIHDVLAGMNIKGPIERPEIKKMSWFMRKMLKLDPIPKSEDAMVTAYRPPGTINDMPMLPQPVHSIFTEGVAIYPLGIRKDPKQDFKFTLADGTIAEYYQEGL